MYANERLISTDDAILDEAICMAAQGTGITGGEPLMVLDRTLHVISLLKDTFGTNHHIHLYTSVLDALKADAVMTAGLDELRVHPPIDLWGHIDSSVLGDIAAQLHIPIGLEIPLIPHLHNETFSLIQWAESSDIAFINLNELEFSDTNGDALRHKGYELKNDISSAVGGSELLGYKIVEASLDIPIHYCSSSFKDAVQLRKRLLRQASITAPLYASITEDGTLLKGVIVCPAAAVLDIITTYSIDPSLFRWDADKQWAETSPEIARVLSHSLSFSCYIIEEYPTADRLEVEREPL